MADVDMVNPTQVAADGTSAGPAEARAAADCYTTIGRRGMKVDWWEMRANLVKDSPGPGTASAGHCATVNLPQWSGAAVELLKYPLSR